MIQLCACLLQVAYVQGRMIFQNNLCLLSCLLSVLLPLITRYGDPTLIANHAVTHDSHLKVMEVYQYYQLEILLVNFHDVQARWLSCLGDYYKGTANDQDLKYIKCCNF